jgi:Protein of unknown function (DUF3300)
MRKALAIVVMFGLIYMPLLDAAAAAAPARREPAAAARQDQGQDQTQDQGQDQSAYEPYSADQLDNLLAPIALYPDPLLAQVLLAATFADQVDEAARYVRAYGQNGIDDQDWDVSVKAVAHYPTVLYMMADQLDWTTALGQAYVYQSTDVMASVQRLRGMAQAQGNLVTSPQEQVVDQDGYIYIWPAQPQYLYVPVFDPYLIYYRRWPGSGPLFLTFGVGFLIGAWLNYDCDWGHRRIYYTGWNGRGWIERSRPYVRVNNVYVNSRYRNINVNRAVLGRNVNYYNLNRYSTVHRDANFDNRARNRNDFKPNPRVNNQLLQRNIDTGNPQLDRYRGHQQAPPGQRPVPLPPARPAPEPPARTAPSNRPVPPSGARPQQQPRMQTQPPPQSQPQTQQQPGAFNRGEGGFSPRATSQRGQTSRSEARQPSRPAPSRPSAPQRPAPQRSAPAPRSQGRPR